jgi:hypothetical protein
VFDKIPLRTAGVASTILQQLGGGNRVTLMTGMPPQVDEKTRSVVLLFKRGRAKGNPSYLRVQLTTADEYDLKAVRITMPKINPNTGDLRPYSEKIVDERKNVQVEGLLAAIRDMTGIALSIK